jgi:cytoskeletal protein RodZ
MIEHEPDPLRRIPTKHTIDAHVEIGAILRAARLKRGQSIDAVAQQTRIPKRYLESLENDRLDEFPAFVYMRGFLKGYCEHLDVPFDELWAKVQPPADAPTEPGSPAAAPKPSASTTPAPSAPTSAASSSGGHAPRPQNSTVHSPAKGDSSATGAIVFALAAALALCVWMMKAHRPAAAVKPAESTPRALMPMPRATEPKVVLRAIDDAWVRVSVDDATVFEGRLPRGAVQEWKPARTVVLRTTAPSSLQLTVNGAPQALNNPSSDGEYRIEVQ